MKGLFFTGTDTGLGKTWVTSIAARHLAAQSVAVGVYKPTASGIEDGRWADVVTLGEAVGGGFPDERICPQRFTAPLAPPEAARQENREVDAALLRTGIEWWEQRVEVLLVEGVGGLLCPLTDTETVADLAADLAWPLVIVARDKLGTINHTLLTIDAARSRDLQIAGVVLNQLDPSDALANSLESHIRAIEHYGNVDVLGHVVHGDRDLLPSDGTATIDWMELARCRP